MFVLREKKNINTLNSTVTKMTETINVGVSCFKKSFYHLTREKMVKRITEHISKIRLFHLWHRN